MDYIDEVDWPIVAKRYGMPNPYQLKDRPQKPSSMSKSASRSTGSNPRTGDVSPRGRPCASETSIAILTVLTVNPCGDLAS